MSYQFDFSAIYGAWRDLLEGCARTLEMTSISVVFAMLIALVVMTGRRSESRIWRWPARTFIEVVRNTPFLVQVFFIFFGLPTLGLRMTAGTGAIIALSFNGGAYAAEIIRGGIDSIDKGQIEAAKALGMNRWQIYRDVVMRPALRAIYPSLTSQFILLLLTSSIVSSISATELTSIAERLEALTFRSFEVYISVTVLYLAMSLMTSLIFKGIGRIYFSYPTR